MKYVKTGGELFQNRKGHGENRFIINFDVNRIITRFGKLQVVNFVDQVNPLDWAFGLKLAGENLALLLHGKAHADIQDMVASLTICYRNEPYHLRMGKGKLTSLDLGEDSKKRLFPSNWVDINAVASKPGEKLWFGTQKNRNERDGLLVGAGKQTPFSSGGKSEGLTSSE